MGGGGNNTGSNNRKVAVTFLANISDIGVTAWLGHIWVRFEGVGTFGFYPDGVRNDSARNADVSYSFRVSQAKANRGLQVVDSYRRSYYTFVTKNCKSLVRDVAVAIGLRTPSLLQFGLSPASFLGELVDLN